MFSMRSGNSVRLLAFATLCVGGTPFARAQCGSWDNRFGADCPPASILATWDADGDGPLPARLIAGGSFRSFGGVNDIARWDGIAWQGMGIPTLAFGKNGSLRCCIAWDVDGAEGNPPVLVVAGRFAVPVGNIGHGIFTWDGTTLNDLNSGVEVGSAVQCVTTLDTDGDGPGTPVIVAGGTFHSAGSVPAMHIARWDGVAWSAFDSGTDAPVLAVASWDPDGPGALSAQLIAGGQFALAGGTPVNFIARWDGAAWHSVGGGVNGEVNQIITWDPDGNGPLGMQLVIAGNFTEAGGAPIAGIARWDGTAWHPLGGGFTGASSLGKWDPDAEGPIAEQLIAAGTFQSIDGMTVNGLARWDGQQWHAVGDGLQSWGGPTLSWDPDATGPELPKLVCSGVANVPSSFPIGGLSLWNGEPAAFESQPTSVVVAPGSLAEFHCSTGTRLMTFQWRRDGTDLIDGPTGVGSFIFGSQSSTLFIDQVQALDAGEYSVVIENECGALESAPATLSLPSTCFADANGDHSVDGADLSFLLGVFGQSVAEFPAAAGADFNADSQINGADLSVLLTNFGATC